MIGRRGKGGGRGMVSREGRGEGAARNNDNDANERRE